MADLQYPPFVNNARIRKAADNAPALRAFDNDHAAVMVLQQALIKAGFAIRDGATGIYGQETADAVKAVESKFNLRVRDTGVAGHEVITQLDRVLRPKPAEIEVPPATLNVLLQRTDDLNGFSHNPMIAKARALMAPFKLTLNVVDRRVPGFPFPGGAINPRVLVDKMSVLERAVKQIPGMDSHVRIMLCPFIPSVKGEAFFGDTSGGQFPLPDGRIVRDFILINTLARRHDDCTMLHEMIHATGLVDHDDSDPKSVFFSGDDRTTLKPEHALRLAKSGFAS